MAGYSALFTQLKNFGIRCRRQRPLRTTPEALRDVVYALKHGHALDVGEDFIGESGRF